MVKDDALPGQTIQDFRGDWWTFQYLHTNGKVIVKDKEGDTRELNQSVFPNLIFKLSSKT